MNLHKFRIYNLHSIQEVHRIRKGNRRFKIFKGPLVIQTVFNMIISYLKWRSMIEVKYFGCLYAVVVHFVKGIQFTVCLRPGWVILFTAYNGQDQNEYCRF